MKSLNHITPIGQLVRFDNINIIADLSPCLETFNIEGLYKLNGSKIEWGDRATESGEIYNEKFRETLYNEIDNKKFFLVSKQKDKKIVDVSDKDIKETIEL
jgi:hypothetical protein